MQKDRKKIEGEMMKTWRVWFEQANQDMFEVEAETEQEAIVEAKEKWMRRNDTPDIIRIEEMKL
jgi:1,2-phenylacetyl-CoA epoxidase PaaB subunit